MSPSRSAEVTATLLEHRDAFRAFLTSRVGNPADAEDLLQTGLVKALQRAEELKDNEKLTAWFYRILRNVIIDHVRSRKAAALRENAWAWEANTLRDDSEADRQLCACFKHLLLQLKPNEAELLRRVELQDEPVARASAALGMTANHGSVTLHRARAELRNQLIEFCGDCDCLSDCRCA